MKITKNVLNKIIMEEIQLHEKDKVTIGADAFINKLRTPDLIEKLNTMEPSELETVEQHLKKLITLASDDDVMINVGTIGDFFRRLDNAMEQILKSEKEKDQKKADKEEKEEPLKKEKEIDESIEIEL